MNEVQVAFIIFVFMNSIVGIDLGTATSEAYSVSEENYLPVKGRTGNADSEIFPSVVTVDPNCMNEVTFATATRAKNIYMKNPENQIFEAKRLLGRKFNDDCVRSDCLYWPFTVKEGEDGLPYYAPTTKNPEGLLVSPVDVSAEVIRNMMAASGLKGTISAVISVPSYFNNEQIEATKAAGRKAGVDVMGCIPEPVAACISYTIEKKTNGYYLVYDLGGGTFDCCVIHVENGKHKVLISEGDNHLGGSNFDNAIMRHFIPLIEEKCNISFYNDKKKLAILKNEVVKLKISLTDSRSAKLKISFQNLPEFNAELTRAEFEGFIKADIERTINCMNKALETINLRKSQIEEILLVGGSTRIPYVRARVSEWFGRAINPNLIDAEKSVALGAALYADHLYRGVSLLYVQNADRKWICSNSDDPLIFRHRNELTGLGNKLLSIPYNIYMNFGQGLIPLFSQGQTWRENVYDSHERRFIRVVKYLSPASIHSEVIPFKVYQENPEDHTLTIIGRMDFAIDPRVWQAMDQRTGHHPVTSMDLQNEVVLLMIAEYDEYGHLRMTVSMQGSQIRDSIEITCRGDDLDNYEEKQRVQALHAFEREVYDKMFVLCRDSKYLNCPNEKERKKYQKWRVDLKETLIWLKDSSVNYMPRDFENRRRLVAKIKV